MHVSSTVACVKIIEDVTWGAVEEASAEFKLLTKHLLSKDALNLLTAYTALACIQDGSATQAGARDQGGRGDPQGACSERDQHWRRAADHRAHVQRRL